MGAFDPPSADVERAVRTALDEDLPAGDATGDLLDPSAVAVAVVAAREPGVLAGVACALEAFRRIDERVTVRALREDGAALEAGDRVLEARGPLRSIVAAERTALNFLCHLSGVATATRSLVDAVHQASRDVVVLDTRKTTPGLRSLEKAAVRAGGGANHRASLSDAVLVKDNHLGALAIADAVALARERHPSLRVEVECDTEAQVAAAVEAGADAVLLDNMTPQAAAACVELVRAAERGPEGPRRHVTIEASGGITVETAPLFAAAGVDAVSSGALTHSVAALDLGLDLVER